MGGEDLRPESKAELPVGILISGIITISLGIGENILGVSIFGIIMIIIAASWILKIRMRSIDPNIKETHGDNDLEKRDWHNPKNTQK